MKKFLKSLFQDERGSASSKRICGILCTLVLCTCLVLNLYSEKDIHLSDILVECVTALAFGCLGLSSLDKFSLRNPNTP